MLFADVVAGQPGEVEPVADLPFDIGLVRLRGGVPETALVPIAVALVMVPMSPWWIRCIDSR